MELKDNMWITGLFLIMPYLINDVHPSLFFFGFLFMIISTLLSLFEPKNEPKPSKSTRRKK